MTGAIKHTLVDPVVLVDYLLFLLNQRDQALLRTAVERIWLVYDSQGQILARDSQGQILARVRQSGQSVPDSGTCKTVKRVKTRFWHV